jgi:uncharacterized damage-inducible protein DinB
VIDAALRAFATHERINQYLIENLAPEVWPLGAQAGKGRSVQAIVAHMHNVRLMWLKAILPKGSTIPEQLDKDSCTREQSQAALAASYEALVPVLREGLQSGKVKGFSPDAISFLLYLVSHESHHRGQIASMAKRLGHPVPKSVEFGMWEWGSRAKEISAGGKPSA